MTIRVFSDEDLERLRSFPEINREELIRFFTLTSADVEFIDPGRGGGPSDRLGLAVQLCTLPLAGDRRHVLDDATMERVVRVFTEEVELLAVYGEQLNRWHSRSITIAQRLEVERLRRQLAHNRDVDATVLSLAEQLKASAIEAILAKSDLELGLEVSDDRCQVRSTLVVSQLPVEAWHTALAGGDPTLAA